MFDDGKRKANKITSKGQNVDKINIALAFNVCQNTRKMSNRKETIPTLVSFAQNASRGFSA